MPGTRHVILALNPLLPPEMARLEERFNVVRLYNEPDPEATLQTVRTDVVGIVSAATGKGVRRTLMEAMPNLEIISQFGVGTDNIDLEAASERKIAVTNTPDVLTDDTADVAVSLVLALSRRICEADMFVRVGKWSSGARFPLGVTLKGKTAGIVGLGRIGKAIAKRLVAFDMRIAYHGRKQKADLAWPYYADLEKLAEVSDYLICAVPGGPDTYHMVNERVLSALGPKGYFVNIARGSIVDQDTLVSALTNQTIAGAGLDVYANEPQVPDALKGMDNVVLLPHIGSATVETRTIMGEIVLANLEAHFSGKPLITPVV